MNNINKEFEKLEGVKERVIGTMENNRNKLNAAIASMEATNQKVDGIISANEADLNQIDKDLDDLLNSL